VSRKALLQTLTQIEKRIEKSSQAFRTLVSDKKAHSIKLDSEEIKKQVQNELLSREGFDKIPGSIIKVIEEEVPQMVATLYNQMRPENFNQNLRRAYIASDLIGNNKSFTVVLATKSEGSNRSVFAYFRRLKQAAQRPLIKRLNSQIKKLNSGKKNPREGIKSSAFLDIGHEEASAVSKQRKRIIEQSLWDFQPASKEASAFIAKLADEVSFNIVRNPGEPIDVIEVSLESKALNRGLQAKAEKEAAGELNKTLLAAVEDLGAQYWADQEGSDSKVDRMQKSVLNELTQDKFKSKNVRSNIKKSKISNKTSKASSKKRKSRGKKQPTVQDDKKVILESFQERNQDLLSLQALLNSKLPTEIRKNMGYPRLENRTGRFADSVRVTDISLTRKGFPSIGYTYQKQPYQVFEQGAGRAPWANERRDPRSLIDVTVREIASEILVGRFFTRRV
jgi:hypothetical protein